MFIQTLLTGLAIGGIYALMAVGYSLVFSILNFSNFAYGSIIMLGVVRRLLLPGQAGAPPSGWRWCSPSSARPCSAT